jgi:hypothetical protein
MNARQIQKMFQGSLSANTSSCRAASLQGNTRPPGSHAADHPTPPMDTTVGSINGYAELMSRPKCCMHARIKPLASLEDIPGVLSDGTYFFPGGMSSKDPQPPGSHAADCPAPPTKTTGGSNGYTKLTISQKRHMQAPYQTPQKMFQGSLSGGTYFFPGGVSSNDSTASW